MSLLVVEILLALVALQRGWRTAPLLLVALSALALALASKLAALFAPWVGPYFEPEGVALTLTHGLSLLGLLVACWASPAELPVPALRLRATRRRSGPLYQI